MNKAFKGVFTKLKKQQVTIDKLLESKKIFLRGKDDGDDIWKLDVIYQKPDCSMGFVECDRAKTTGAFPSHLHPNSIEYLICIKGSALFVMEGGVQRILCEGDCAAVPAGRNHHSEPLENNTKIAYVCIPHDDTIPEK